RLVGAAQLATAPATGAHLRLRPRLESGTPARAAQLVLGHLDLLLHAKDRILERDLNVGAEVGAPLCPRPPPGARGAPEERIENVFEPEAAETREPAIEGRIGGYVSKPVVRGALLSVLEDLVGLVDLLEALARVGVL